MSTFPSYSASQQAPPSSSKFNIDHLLYSASQRMAKATSSLLPSKKPSTSSSKASTNRALTGRIIRTKSANTSPQRPLTSSRMNQRNVVHPYLYSSAPVQQPRRQMSNGRPSSWHPGHLQVYNEAYQQHLQALNYQQQKQQQAALFSQSSQTQSATNSRPMYLPQVVPSPQAQDPYLLTPFYPSSVMPTGVPFYSPALSFGAEEETSFESMLYPYQNSAFAPVYPELNRGSSLPQYNHNFTSDDSEALPQPTEPPALVATKANPELVSIDLYSDPRPDRTKRNSQDRPLSLTQLKLVQPWEPTLDDEDQEDDDEEEESEDQETVERAHTTQNNHIDLTDSDDEADGEPDDQAQPTPQADATLPPLHMSLSKQDLPTYDYTYNNPYPNVQDVYVPLSGYYPGLEGPAVQTPPQWPLMSAEPQQYAMYRQEARYSLPLDPTRLWI